MPRAVVATFVLTLCAVAPAQIGVRTHHRLVDTVYLGTGGNSQFDSGWVPAGPLLVGDSASSEFAGCRSAAGCVLQAEFGYLHATGSGAANSTAFGTADLLFDEFIGGMPKCMFQDQVTFVAPGLPSTTIVQLQATVELQGDIAAGGGAPWKIWHADVDTGGWPTLSTQNPPGGYSSNSTVYQFALSSHPLFLGQLFVSAGDGGVHNFNSAGTWTCDLGARFRFECLTPGVQLVWASGRDYGTWAARAEMVGTSCGTAPPVHFASAPRLGTNCTMSVRGAPANAPLWIGWSISTASPTPFGGCTMQLDLATAAVLAATVADASGAVDVLQAVPSAAVYTGLQVTTQALPFVANGPFLGIGELTNGVQLTLGF